MNVSILNRVATVIIVVVVVIIGGIVVLTDPDRLSFAQYLSAVGVAVGLLGVGYGLDKNSSP